MTVALGPPVLPAIRSSSVGKTTSTKKKGMEEVKKKHLGAMGQVLQVVRHDRDFLRAATAPLSRALGDLFWLRHLEDPRARHHPCRPARWPSISYPPGLSCMDLMIADLEALKLYFGYFLQSYKNWFTPLPEQYDPQKVADYFSYRPHVLALRIIEVSLQFVSAAIKLQASRSLKLRRHGANRNGSSDSSRYYVGRLLKETLLNLGPTFIKVGQSLSTRPDIIGSEICEALSELHDKVPPFPRAIAMKIIEEELECPLDNIFSYISDEPVAAASFGQVYRGCTLDGTVVAIKVQRPNLLHSVVRDIYILRLGLTFLRKVAKRKSDLALYADELGKGFVGELDYTIEAANASEFLEAHSRYSFILVPKVFRQFTRKRILTMEWVVGENPNDLLLLSKGSGHENYQYSDRKMLEAKASLLDLVNKGVEASLIQLLETGLLHADPHSGNLRYISEGRIGFLDFGLLCRMEKKHQLAMLASIVHIVNGDWGALVYDLTQMDVVRPGTNLRRVTMDLEGALGEVTFKDGVPDIKFSKVLATIWSIALNYQFRMPPYYTLLLRSLASLEGLAVAVDQNFKTFQAAYPYVVQKLLYDNSTATRKILYSVIFNKRKELQWQKIMLFLKVGSMRKGVNVVNELESNPIGNVQDGKAGVYEIANLILKLLLAKNGVVLRRLLMTADGMSLARALVSKDAVIVHQLVSGAIADFIYQWMAKAVAGNKAVNQYEHHFVVAKGKQVRELETPSLPVLQAVMTDRRLKIIFYKVLKDLRRDPILTLKVSWSSFIIFATGATIGLHRFVVYLSEEYLRSLSFIPKGIMATG
ncbi:uncharacterized protein [Typha latifolia]|uniref:uncharacterized protein n=1 Tax=Typha latifolia TaxID=4733 RepID=UPI003C2DC820